MTTTAAPFALDVQGWPFPPACAAVFTRSLTTQAPMAGGWNMQVGAKGLF